MSRILLVKIILCSFFSFHAFSMEIKEVRKGDYHDVLIEEANEFLEATIYPEKNCSIDGKHAASFDEGGALFRLVKDARKNDRESLTPLAFVWLLKKKLPSKVIEKTFVVLLKYPKFPKEIAKNFANTAQIVEHMNTKGGIFSQFKSHLRDKIKEQKDFNICLILPDAHFTLIAYRVDGTINKLFVIDSVGTFMKFQAALSETINKAIKETAFAQNSYVLFGNSIRQADTWSCPILNLKDLKHISKYPQLLTALWESVPEEKRISVDQSKCDYQWANVFEKLPVHLLKYSQIFLENLENERCTERLLSSNDKTIGDYVARLEKSPKLSNPKIGRYYQSLAATEGLIASYLAEVYQGVENLSDAEVKAIYQTIFIDLYSTIQCVVCRQLPPSDSPLRCGNCKKTNYCSRECQKAHWLNEHRASCIKK